MSLSWALLSYIEETFFLLTLKNLANLSDYEAFFSHHRKKSSISTSVVTVTRMNISGMMPKKPSAEWVNIEGIMLEVSLIAEGA